MLAKHRDLFAACRAQLLEVERALLAEQFAATDRDEVERAVQARRHATGLKKALDRLTESAPSLPATPGRQSRAASSHIRRGDTWRSTAPVR